MQFPSSGNTHFYRWSDFLFSHLLYFIYWTASPARKKRWPKRVEVLPTNHRHLLLQVLAVDFAISSCDTSVVTPLKSLDVNIFFKDNIKHGKISLSRSSKCNFIVFSVCWRILWFMAVMQVVRYSHFFVTSSFWCETPSASHVCVKSIITFHLKLFLSLWSTIIFNYKTE